LFISHENKTVFTALLWERGPRASFLAAREVNSNLRASFARDAIISRCVGSEQQADFAGVTSLFEKAWK